MTKLLKSQLVSSTRLHKFNLVPKALFTFQGKMGPWERSYCRFSPSQAKVLQAKKPSSEGAYLYIISFQSMTHLKVLLLFPDQLAHFDKWQA